MFGREGMISAMFSIVNVDFENRWTTAIHKLANDITKITLNQVSPTRFSKNESLGTLGYLLLNLVKLVKVYDFDLPPKEGQR